MAKGIYDMPISKSWFGLNIIKDKDFDKAKCPICKKQMTYKDSPFVIEFACYNIKCKGYYRWLGSHGKNFFGHIYLD